MAMNDRDVLFLHQQEQLRGRLAHQLADAAADLQVGLSALAKGRVEVTAERMEVVHDLLRQLVAELQ